MRVINLQAENFKILQAIEITPEGNVVTIGGKNGQGKTSVLDAIWVALVGRGVAPPKPIRNGEEKATIRLDLGEIIVTRTFTDKGTEKFTDTLKVVDEAGRSYPSPQRMLDDLLGEIGFDPFAFVQMKPDKQAETLLQMVPLSIDIDELADEDARDYETRRDLNRRAKELRAQIAGITVPATAPEPMDRDALVNQLGEAANTNSELQREEIRRNQMQDTINGRKARVGELTATIGRLEDQIAAARDEVAVLEKGTVEREAELAALPPIAEPVDTDALREKIREADAVADVLARIANRKLLTEQAERLESQSDDLTTAMNDRETERVKALQEARMPIDGLGIAIEGKATRVIFNGVPFEQASTAEQLRASTAIAMAANPQLRVLRIKDGSLLDDDSMALLAQMANENDYQLWIERVGTGGVGIVIENGAVKGAPPAEPSDEDKAKKATPKGTKPAAKDKPEGSLL